MRPTNSPKASLLIFSFALGLLFFLSPAQVNAQVPDGYMSCALEGERCQFEGTKEVLYGFGTQFSRKTATGFIECSVNGFGGDPAPNIRKKCYIPYNPQTDSPGIQRYNFCGMEGERCKFYGQRKVMYGAGDKWAIVVVSDGIDCNVSQFGDPAPNVVKKCFFSDYVIGSDRDFPETFTGAPLTLERIHYSGNWISVYRDGTPRANPNVTITQNGDVLTDQFGFTMLLTGTGIVENSDGRKRTGKVSENGTKITWSDGRIWIKQVATTKPREFPDTYTNPNVLRANPPATGSFPGFNAEEMRCVNMTQGHIFFDYDANSQPITNWSDQDLYTLCRGTVVPMRTIECFVDARNNIGPGDGPVLAPKAALSKCTGSAFKPPKPRLGEDEDIVNKTPKGQTFAEANTLLRDEKPLNEFDTQQVMRWIANQVAAVRVPFCWKQSKARGASTPRGLMDNCPAGWERDVGTCHPPCPPDFNGYRDAFTCYQTCVGNRPFNCLAFGCAKDAETCNSTTDDQFIAGGTLAFNIVSTAIGNAGGAAAKVEKVSKLAKAAEHLQSLVENAQKVYTAVTTIQSAVELYQTLAATNFDVLTSPEIEAAIDKKFGRIGGYYIKRQYALVHLGLTGDANLQASVKNVSTLVGLLDPTGLIDVWTAFFHPICNNDFPFPNVALRYIY